MDHWILGNVWLSAFYVSYRASGQIGIAPVAADAAQWLAANANGTSITAPPPQPPSANKPSSNVSPPAPPIVNGAPGNATVHEPSAFQNNLVPTPGALVAGNMDSGATATAISFGTMAACALSLLL